MGNRGINLMKMLRKMKKSFILFYIFIINKNIRLLAGSDPEINSISSGLGKFFKLLYRVLGKTVKK